MLAYEHACNRRFDLNLAPPISIYSTQHMFTYIYINSHTILQMYMVQNILIPICRGCLRSPRSRGSTKRAHFRARGDISIPSVAMHNRIARRVAYMLEYHWAKGHFYVLENPLSSILWRYRCIARCLKRHGCVRVVVHLGCFGAYTMKPAPCNISLSLGEVDLSIAIGYVKIVGSDVGTRQNEYPNLHIWEFGNSMKSYLLVLSSFRFWGCDICRF